MSRREAIQIMIGAVLIMLAAAPLVSAQRGTTGLALPQLDLPAFHYGGAWASANSLVFTDLFKHSAIFVPNSKTGTTYTGWIGREQIPWNADGYPTNLNPPSKPSWSGAYSAGAWVGKGAPFYPAGQYVVLYSGTGSIIYEGDATLLSSSPNRHVIQVTPSVGFCVRIIATDPADPVRNIRVVPAEFEGTFTTSDIFHPQFLALLQGIPLLRFSAWNKVSGNAGLPSMQPRNWTARTQPTFQTQAYTLDGVALEHMVQLANRLNVDIWLGMPKTSSDTDTYVTNAAALFATGLNPGLKVYVEYGYAGPENLSPNQQFHTLNIARIWRRTWDSLGQDRTRIVVVASANQQGYVPHLLNYFGPTNIKEVNAVALPGTFGTYHSWIYNLPSPYAWSDDHTFPQKINGISQPDLMKLIRTAQLSSDVVYNRLFNHLRAQGLQVLAYAMGPDLATIRWAARENVDRLTTFTCASFPCKGPRLFPPAIKYDQDIGPTWNTQQDRDAYMAVARANATSEFELEVKLLAARRDPYMRQLVTDFLRRWHTLTGGGPVVVELPASMDCDSTPGRRQGLYVPECAAGGFLPNLVASPTSHPVYQGLRDWMAGGDGGLPKTLADAPPPPPPQCLSGCVWGTCIGGRCECYKGYGGADCSSKQAKPNDCNSFIGMNLEGIRDWGRSWAFVDIMKAGRAWMSTTTWNAPWGDNGVPKALDANDYPTQLQPNQRVTTLMIRDLQGHVPGGIYTVLYDGEGLLDFGMDIRSVRHVEPGRVEVEVRPSTMGNNGLTLSIDRTNPANPVRNIRVIMPGFADTYEQQVFHPAHLSFLEKYNTLRFMDWMCTNNADLPESWEQRPTLSARSYATARGCVPYEHIVDLSNRVGANAWVNIPHKASDAFIASFAAFLRDRLRPDLKVYVEYSNEVWGTGFPGGQWAQQEGVRLGYYEQGARWEGGANNEARLCYVAQRTKDISQIFKGALGDRAVIVVSGQAVWPATSAKMLTCRGATPYIDALATATYFGTFRPGVDTNVDVFVSQTLPDQINSETRWATHGALAKQYGKTFLAYEAGQGLGGDGTANNVALQANRHPGMEQVYRTYFKKLEEGLNMSLVMHYTSVAAFTDRMFWGVMEWQDASEDTSPKLRGILNYLGYDRAVPCRAQKYTNCPGNGVPCSNNGECMANGQCNCYTGYSGADCATTALTLIDNCGYKCTFDQGACDQSVVSGTTRTLSCSCKAGFTGPTCALFTCPNNCNNNGNCIDRDICSCFPGFKGSACEIDCGCNGHGTCSPYSNTCVCDEGWAVGPDGRCSQVQCATNLLSPFSTSSCIAPGEPACTSGCVNGVCIRGTCSCWAGFSGPACTNPVPRPNQGSQAGANVNGLSYWNAEWVFVDVAKQSSSWFTTYVVGAALQWPPWDTNEIATISFRPDGYPVSLPPNKVVHKLMARNVQRKFPAGRYVCLYEGEGSISFDFDSKLVSQAKGRVEFEFTPSWDEACATNPENSGYCNDNGIHVLVRSTNPANPVRNLRIIMPGFEATEARQPFHPAFLKAVERYSVLRFMTWMNANSDVNPGPWSTRTTPSSHTQAGPKGVAMEYIMQLSNMVGAHPWLTVHHLADDDYVMNLAQFVRDNLRQDLVVYVEHSNEVWNRMFAQFTYASNAGKALWGSAVDDYTAAYRYHARRSRQIWAIFSSVLGRSRVRTVLGGWGFDCGPNNCGQRVVQNTLGFENTAAETDFFGVTAYFGCGLGGNGPADNLLTVDDMLSRCDTDLSNARLQAQAVANLVTAYPSVRLLTYEAGPSIVEARTLSSGYYTAGLAAKFIAVNRHPRFEGVFSMYLSMFESVGLVGQDRPFMQFVTGGLPSRYGSWGLQEYTGQPAGQSPKLQALMRWLDSKGLQPYSTSSCMDVSAVSPALGLGLGLNSYIGRPFVTAPDIGDVWVEGNSYPITWAVGEHGGIPAGGNLEISLWQGSDCPGQGRMVTLLSSGTPASAGRIDMQLPPSAPGSGMTGSNYFFRLVELGGSRIFYSAPFSIQKSSVVLRDAAGTCQCVVNPNLQFTATSTRASQFSSYISQIGCGSFPGWPLTTITSQWCSISPLGVRQYRTLGDGSWYSKGKPVDDATAIYSPKPSPALYAPWQPGMQPGQVQDMGVCYAIGSTDCL